MSNLKMTDLDGTSDHHLNMLHRIHLDEEISKLKEEHQKVLNEEKLKRRVPNKRNKLQIWTSNYWKWRKKEVENIFQAVGKKLKNRRQIDESDNLVSYLKEDQMEDPAAKNQDLDKVLIVQAQEGKKKRNKDLDSFYKTHVVNAKSGD